MSDVDRFPICPRCAKPVTSDEHILELRLVNAHKTAPDEYTQLRDAFHHRCAADVWNAAGSAWKARP